MEERNHKYKKNERFYQLDKVKERGQVMERSVKVNLIN